MATKPPAPKPAPSPPPARLPGVRSQSAAERFFAAIGYVGPLILIPILVPKKGRFLYYHTRHALYFFVLFLSLFILTLGLLSLVWPGGFDVPFLFQVLAIIFFLELILYGVAMLALVVLAALGRMPMLPILGELAGEA